MFADDIVGKNSQNELYDITMHLSPDSPIGVFHDWYPMNKTAYNTLQNLQLSKSRLKIPFMLLEECLHGVGSWKQSIFPQNIAMASSWDRDIVYRVGRAIGTEAASIETFGEDKVLTAQIGVAYSSGLSKNGSWADHDAVFPTMKHFAAHGAPQAGHNAAPFTGHGYRQIFEDLLVPFKAVADLGGAKGVMMAYHEVDGVPSTVNTILYKTLFEDWGFEGFTMGDDLAVLELITNHKVASSQADAMAQWYNAGGMIDFYDFSLDSKIKATQELVANGTVSLETLRSHVRRILGVKWDLGLFDDALIAEDVDPLAIVASHRDVALEAAQKSIILLKNEKKTLPLDLSSGKKIALLGPFADVLDFGDYSGQLGQVPAIHATTIRQGMLNNMKDKGASPDDLKCSWGSNSWEYINQYVVAPYHLSANGSSGGLAATYYSNTDFTGHQVTRLETPALDWGLYPPPGLGSNNFSAVWEGELESPADVDLEGLIGVAIGHNSTMRLFVDGELISSRGFGPDGTLLGNIEGFGFIENNSTSAPPGSVPFTFKRGASHHIRIEFQAWNNFKKTANVNSVNSQILLWWNLVSPEKEALAQAVSVAKESDVIVLAVGAAWSSDGESGDRATLGLAPSQDALVEAMFDLGKPVVLVLQGGRPFAIPKHYDRASAVLSAHFGGQAGGQAIADTLFGKSNPGGRVPVSVPYHVGQLPVYYNYKPTAHEVAYLDIPSEPIFPFGFGLSYTSFAVSFLSASVEGSPRTLSFRGGDWIVFTAKVKNTGDVFGSHVAQIYLLGRVSSVTRSLKQLVAFERVYLEAGEETTVTLRLEVDRYLMMLNRKNEWELEKGSYTFAYLENGGTNADTSMNVTMSVH
ncbi:Periplasmic beta-glucosidase [Escovopsis weberi]|uniref:xylan 1,4-beta-xylosidase n=1 Tax=Escovopsis weberi TaxID=150374 RepID=A0A0M8NA35_ESCWE|nr:Periplasmic beta-glucosidase [Escovopsis weberi]